MASNYELEYTVKRLQQRIDSLFCSDCFCTRVGNCIGDVLTFTNGLTEASNVVKLGGALIEDTTIAGGAFNFYVTDSNGFNLQNGLAQLPTAFGGGYIPFAGVRNDISNNELNRCGIMDLTALGIGIQNQFGYLNFTTGEKAFVYSGNDLGTDRIINMQYVNVGATKSFGFSCHKAGVGVNGSADFYIYNNVDLYDYGAIYAQQDGFRQFFAYDIVDVDNWSQHDAELFDTGFIWRVGTTKVAGVTTPSTKFVSFKVGESFIVNDSDVKLENYPNTRDDYTTTRPINYLYTDSAGNVKSALNVAMTKNQQVRVVTAAGAITTANTDYIIIVNKTVGAATAVTLYNTSLNVGDIIIVKDGKGDANANNITITPTAGTIDGAANKVINTAYGVLTFVYNGTEWNLL